jgi:hypothetical protein
MPLMPLRSSPFVAPLLAAALGACATAQAGEIDLDQAVAVANAAARSSLNPGGPLRILIATEKDTRSVKRCLQEDHDPSYVRSVQKKIAGRRLYVIRYPLPPVSLEDGDISYVGTEPCVLIDRETGEVLGMFPD